MTKYIFVSDIFLEDYIGGAELTSEALINFNKAEVVKKRCLEIDIEFVKQNKDKFWIFGNFATLQREILVYFIKNNISYCIVEYDFKLCKYRSPEKHKFIEKQDCSCDKDIHGKIISLFFSKSKINWFMSQRQQEVYEDKFEFLNNSNNIVLSSVFTESTLKKIKSYKVKKNNKWLVLNSQSWIKGTKGCVAYAKKNNLEYSLVGGLSYEDMLKSLASSKGLIFLPHGSDTCPRIVIEAKLLGCKLILNDNVLHKDEGWFISNKKEVAAYLKSRPKYFWKTVEKVWS